MFHFFETKHNIQRCETSTIYKFLKINDLHYFIKCNDIYRAIKADILKTVKMQLKCEKGLFIIGLNFSKLKDHNIERCKHEYNSRLCNLVKND